MKSTSLLFLLIVCFQAKSQSKRVHFGLIPELNYSILEGKNINDESFSKRPSIGFGITALFRFSINEKNAIVSGLKIAFNTYNFDFGKINQVSQNMGFSLPISYEYQMSKKWLLGLGTDLSWRTEYLNVFNQYNTNEELETSVIFKGESIVTLPIRLYIGHSFTSKKGRKSELILTFHKGTKVHETGTLINHDSEPTTYSFFKYKNSYLSLGYRFNFGKSVQ